MAIRDACCMALEAIAASMVKIRLRPVAPRKLIPINCQILYVGSPINAKNKINVTAFMIYMSKRLYRILDSTNSEGLVIA